MKFIVTATVGGEEIFRVRASEQTVQGMVGQAVWVALEESRDRSSGRLVAPSAIDLRVEPIGE